MALSGGHDVTIGREPALGAFGGGCDASDRGDRAEVAELVIVGDAPDRLDVTVHHVER
jgi:hypothetical protein